MIRYFITFISIFFTIWSVSAQKLVQISGTIEGLKTPQAVKLFKVVDGKSKEIATAIPQGGSKFGFNFYPEYEGIYIVGLGGELSPNNNFKFYFKPGDKLDFSIKVTPEFTYSLNGKENTKENKVLTAWHDLVFPLEDKSVNFMSKNSTYVDYFPLQEEIVAKTKDFLKGKSTGNAKFDELMRHIIRLDLVLYATNFLNTPRSAHPSIEEFSPFYSTLKATDLTQRADIIYAYPYGIRTVDGLIRVNQRQNNESYKAGPDGLAIDFKYIANDTIKGDLLLQRIERVKTIDDYENLVSPYQQYLLTDHQKAQDKAIMFPLLDFKPGSKAYQFSYPDINGKNVTMASLKGKVVLVDVWATWCGPCLAEVPYLKQLEEEFKGTDVQIVSISVDEEKDKEKWKKMIAEKELGGIQLFATGWSEITKYYKITGIPRFLVFDKQGNIVTIDAPRPSNPKLKELLEKELAK